MNDVELTDVRLSPNATKVLEQARKAAETAADFWAQDLSCGHLNAADISAAQDAAMELSLIVDGALFLLRRAPKGPCFGLLSERPRLKRRAGYSRTTRPDLMDATEWYKPHCRMRSVKSAVFFFAYRDIRDRTA